MSPWQIERFLIGRPFVGFVSWILFGNRARNNFTYTPTAKRMPELRAESLQKVPPLTIEAFRVADPLSYFI